MPNIPCAHSAAVPPCDGETNAAAVPVPHPSIRASLLRLEPIAPLIARELQASWSDPPRASRLIEEFLGGQRDVQIQTPALIELVELYQSLELDRDTGTADKPMQSDQGAAATRARKTAPRLD
jgi:hypothetical protein